MTVPAGWRLGLVHLAPVVVLPRELALKEVHTLARPGACCGSGTGAEGVGGT